MKHLSVLLCFALALVAIPGFAEDKNKLDQLFEDAAKTAGMIKDRGKPRQVDKTKRPQIIIKGSEIRYNGKVLKLGEPLKKWEKVLGKSARFHGELYAWDSMGVQCRARPPERYVSEIIIHMNFKHKEPWEVEIDAQPQHAPGGRIILRDPDITPKKPFTGYLEIDGAGADRNSKVWEINWNKQGDPNKPGEKKFHQAYLPVIYSTATPPPEEYLLEFRTDRNGQEGTIYNFSITESSR